MAKLTFHLIANAHLDPVWLWDWQEGLNEGIITTRAVLDLMDEFEELTFVRGESAIYTHIEEHDPETFARVVKQVRAGRWDVVGGTVIQPDTNLPATETFARHFAHAQHYFRSRFGRCARVAWAADSFGHAAGLPEIMAEAGITGFAFTRPFAATLPLAKPAFWWEGPGGSRVLAYRPAVGWYGTQRNEMLKRLDETLAAAQAGDLRNVGVFYGLGNHGGGPSRCHLREIRAWAQAHPEVQVVHSGLSRLIAALQTEVKQQGDDFLPVHRGELNFCLRGCYASVARYKFAYRRTEAIVSRAERTDAVIRASLRQPAADTRAAWDAVLFGSFHDILPGSCIERGYDDQLAWLGGATHTAQCTELGALNALANHIDTRVRKTAEDHPTAVPMVAWNPHPWPFNGHLELESNLDYREIYQYKGRADQLPLEVRNGAGRTVPFQTIATENALDWESPWRKRVVVPVALPPFGWQVYTLGWVEGAVPPRSAGPLAAAPREGTITNGTYRVQAKPGAAGVQISLNGKPVFGRGGLSAVVVEDPWGSWGGPDTDEANNLSKVLETWRIERVETVESGPERAALVVRFAGERSWMELTFQLCRGRQAVDVAARVLWNERGARLKLVMPFDASQAEFDVPGGRVVRGPSGDVPGGRWVRVSGARGTLGFASDGLYCFDCTRDAFRATVVRASGYAFTSPPTLKTWRPAVDCGELKFRFLLSPGDAALPQLAQALEQPPTALVAAAHDGHLPRAGSLGALHPAALQIIAIKRADDGRGLVLRVQETAGKAATARLDWLGQKLNLGEVGANTLASWRLVPGRSGWQATRVGICE
jgi:alpha-mannosidase